MGSWVRGTVARLRMRGAILLFHFNLLIGGISLCLHSRSVNINCAMYEDMRWRHNTVIVAVNAVHCLQPCTTVRSGRYAPTFRTQLLLRHQDRSLEAAGSSETSMEIFVRSKNCHLPQRRLSLWQASVHHHWVLIHNSGHVHTGSGVHPASYAMEFLYER